MYSVIFFGVDHDNCDGTRFELRFSTYRMMRLVYLNLKYFGFYIDDYSHVWRIVKGSLREVIEDEN